MFYDNFRNHPKMEGDLRYYPRIIIIITDIINVIISISDYDPPRVIGDKIRYSSEEEKEAV